MTPPASMRPPDPLCAATAEINLLRSRIEHLESGLRIAAARENDIEGMLARSRETMVEQFIDIVQNGGGVSPSAKGEMMARARKLA